MILNVMKVFQYLSFTKEVDSINFKNAIIQSQLPFELPEFEKDNQRMFVKEEFGNHYFGDLIIENYPNLQKFIVKNNTLQHLKSLKICNNEKLKTIKIGEFAFQSVQNMIIDSTEMY